MKRLLAAFALVACTRPAVSPVAIDPRDLAPGDHEVVVDGHRLRFHVAGEGPVCIAHPGGPGAEWSYLRMPALEARVKVVYLEPIGTGASDRLANPKDYWFPRYAADVDGVRAHLGLDRVCVIGHSHGGFVAQSWAIAHPSNVSALVLYGTAPALDDAWAADMRANMAALPESFADAKAAFGELWDAPSDDAATATFRRMAKLYFADWDALAPETRRIFEGLRIAAAPLRATGPMFDVTAKLSSLSVPTLVVAGRHDIVMSPKTAARLRDAIPGARLVVLEKSGHMGHLEEPEAFASAVGDFVVGAVPRR